jgi:hypothetical protein
LNLECIGGFIYLPADWRYPPLAKVTDLLNNNNENTPLLTVRKKWKSLFFPFHFGIKALHDGAAFCYDCLGSLVPFSIARA